ncbi:hypothetical protein GL2_35820 [Microbulbifer sp. GL-2]|nr:hypothetical protein GL2_35820 [Microbulbifer sp. GL-2]
MPDGIHRLFCLAFLDKADNGINDNHSKDHDGIHPMLQKSCDKRRTQQDIDQYIVEMCEKTPQQSVPGRRR